MAHIRPIYKNKGLKSCPASFRPISETSAICRTLEDIYREQLFNYIMQNNLLSSVQYGFIKNRSTLSQQINLLNELTLNYENNLTTSIIYLDFSKAFDSVCHSKLIYILTLF